MTHSPLTKRQQDVLPRQRKALELRMAGLTYREIAERLGYSQVGAQKAVLAAQRKDMQVQEFERHPLPEPTDAMPGTQEKVAVLEQRAELKQRLWHPDDANVHDWRPPYITTGQPAE